MLFNSIEFSIFLPVVFILYWFVTNNNLKLQNTLLIVASYFFYGWWDWRFLSLLIFSSSIDYLIGVQLSKTEQEKKRKLLLYASLAVNLGFLCFFKYFNFFVESFSDAFTLFGSKLSISRLNIILPVGISFYTFQTLSYSIDVYKRKLEPTKDPISFFAFVSFFPQLVAGPIERATNLLPQFYKKRVFEYHKAIDGCRQILWGLFKKIVIADNCAQYANLIFANYENLNGSTLLLGAIFFTFQIYGDFSGYSDIAIGTSRLFGFNLMQNFNSPYFSRDIGEFWRRWHISLNTWFRDYIYIPLGGSKGPKWQKTKNVFIVFLLSGLWHGANWTFVVWGFLNACYFIPLLLTNNNRKNSGKIAEGKFAPSFKELLHMILTFYLTVLAWVFFRAENIKHAINYLEGMFSYSLFEIPKHFGGKGAFETSIIILIFMIIEWFGRDNAFAIEKIDFLKRKWLRFSVYYIILSTILYFSLGTTNKDFIYFQF